MNENMNAPERLKTRTRGTDNVDTNAIGGGGVWGVHME